jgi:hypothetical protein
VQGDILSQRTRQVAPRTPGVYGRGSYRKWASSLRSMERGWVGGLIVPQPQPPVVSRRAQEGDIKTVKQVRQRGHARYAISATVYRK